MAISVDCKRIAVHTRENYTSFYSVIGEEKRDNGYNAQLILSPNFEYGLFARKPNKLSAASDHTEGILVDLQDYAKRQRLLLKIPKTNSDQLFAFFSKDAKYVGIKV